jgi:hypothetical protein
MLLRLEPQDARKSLGIMMVMDGSHLAQIEFLPQKAVDFADHIPLITLEKNDVWQALTSIFMWIIEYLMLAVTINERQWDYIMALITMHILPKSGLVQRFPHVVLYAPTKFQG